MGDINKTLLTGVAETRPTLTKLPQSHTSLCHFVLRVEERFYDGKGVEQVRPNFFKVESLGKQSHEVFDKVKIGGRYLIDGYLRQENSNINKPDIIKIRTYGVITDPTMENHHYKRGLEKALNVLVLSRDIPGAVEALEDILAQL